MNWPSIGSPLVRAGGGRLRSRGCLWPQQGSPMVRVPALSDERIRVYETVHAIRSRSRGHLERLEDHGGPHRQQARHTDTWHGFSYLGSRHRPMPKCAPMLPEGILRECHSPPNPPIGPRWDNATRIQRFASANSGADHLRETRTGSPTDRQAPRTVPLG